MLKHILCGAAILTLTSCGARPVDTIEAGSLKTLDIKEQVPAGGSGNQVAEDSAEKLATPAVQPQIAYSYSYGYRLSDGDIDSVQQKHIALCDKQGSAHCRIVTMERASNDGQFATASLILEIDARQARAFSTALDQVVSSTGGDTSNRAIQAEDLSKQMVDSAARIKAKQALTDRLLILLQNRSGKVGELVEAERAFADAQEELEAARTWMREMEQRVALSKITITYNSRSPSGGGFWAPVRNSFASAGQLLGNSISGLIAVIVIILPWVLLIIGVVWLRRRWFKNAAMPWTKWRRQDKDTPRE